MKKITCFVIGFVCGFGVCLGALAVYLLILMSGSYHYVMEYPHTEVWIDKDKKIRSIDFDVRENPRLLRTHPTGGRTARVDERCFSPRNVNCLKTPEGAPSCLKTQEGGGQS